MQPASGYWYWGQGGEGGVAESFAEGFAEGFAGYRLLVLGARVPTLG